MLESIGFCWDFKEAAWSQRFNELVAYKQVHGNCNVPFDFPDNPPLGFWVSEQRRQRRKLMDGDSNKAKTNQSNNSRKTGRKRRAESQSTALTNERISALEEIGFCWNRLEAAWDERYQELVAYKARFGDCKVPQGFKENPGLAIWVRTQRMQYRKLKEGNKNHMTERRIEALEKIGFVWSYRKSSTKIID
mmetsp:Transcript_2674/g.4167  ORF Transcript_2674/g.4167 Transcript_2674/m.4167 type:complete len:191 (+) Transcript_2674:206-778(+)